MKGAGYELFGWGQNNHMQVNGMQYNAPNSNKISQTVILPELIPFFQTKLPDTQVELIGACRSRSIALLSNGKVFEWGYKENDT
jgi:alpha-tubulin suppressor-like RCC1 family protein